jgi:hypothetical protein
MLKILSEAIYNFDLMLLAYQLQKNGVLFQIHQFS